MKRLEVGSGNRPTPGYDHIDANPDLPHLEYVCEMDNIPVPDQTYDEVIAIHVIEHVGLERAKRSLLEWFRVMRSGGILRVDTPNVGLNATLYADALKGGTSWLRYYNSLLPTEKNLCEIDGTPSPALWFNFKAFSTEGAWNTHYWNADPTLLKQLFVNAGFEDVKTIQEDPSVIVTGRKP